MAPRLTNVVRRERTASELNRLTEAMGDWLTRRRKADCDAAGEYIGRRLARTAADVQQITTGTVCHLDADMVAAASDRWDLPSIDFLFVENVGNLVCPCQLRPGRGSSGRAPLGHRR
jgi:hypothetical protein